MADGPGKYDDLASLVRERTKARGVLLLVLDGHLGSGFSAQMPLVDQLQMPALLRTVAEQIEKDNLMRGPKA